MTVLNSPQEIERTALPVQKIKWVREEHGEIVDLLVLPEGTQPPTRQWQRAGF